MKNTLYIIWQKSFDQDDSIFDEQHHALYVRYNQAAVRLNIYPDAFFDRHG